MSPSKRHFFTIFIISNILLSFEVLLTRIFSVIMWYHFAFLAISIAMFGISMGSLFVSIFPISKHRLDAETMSKWALFLFPLAILIAAIVFFYIPYNPANLDTTNIALLGTILFFTLVPFILGGMIIANLYRCHRHYSWKLYAWDLTGASLACISTLFLLEYLGAPTAYFAIIMLAVMVSLLNDTILGEVSKRTYISCLFLLLTLVVLATNNQYHWLSVKYSKGKKETGLLFSGWNSLSRVCVFDPQKRNIVNKPKVKNPVSRVKPVLTRNINRPTRILSKKNVTALPPVLELVIDSSAGTYIRRYTGNLESINKQVNPVFSMVYRIHPGNKALIIGPGGGQDIYSALVYGYKSVVAVEINPLVVEAVEEVFGEYAGNIYTRPGVSYVIDDGRHYVRNSKEKFDVIQATLIDTWAATAAGAYALSENTLYTAEAFGDYINHLSHGGIVSFSRFYFQPPRQTLRLVSLARHVLEKNNINPANSILVVRKGMVSTILVKNGTFSEFEIQKCMDETVSCNAEMVYYPGIKTPSYFSQLLTISNPEIFFEKYPYDVTPPTDKKPYFFHFIKPRDWFRFKTPIGQKHLYQASHILTILFLGSIFMGLLTLFISLLYPWSRDKSSHGNSIFFEMMYFAGIGMGFIMIEITLIQFMTLFLGHPAYSISVILFSFLLFSGLGSYYSFTGISMKWYLTVLVVLIYISIYSIPSIINVLVGYPRFVKIVVSLLILSPFGFIMGKPFPWGIRTFGNNEPVRVPLAYAVNGAFSVTGSVTAMVIGITMGYNWILYFAGACYGLALLCCFMVSNNKTRLGST